ncbi:MerR family transcriptional regulator [Streptomyces sp. NPDC057540]|uniref:MerR family transcriptional regulator n=1 Tax=Streptomyces sp. NPDC057540 TaxID=3346160 RepID=UPI00367883E5
MEQASEAQGPVYTVDELAARAGVTVRTVRFYGTRGLLPPPVIGARRVGHYGQDHLSRLALIEELQRQGMTLAAIERYLEQLPPDLSAQDLAIHRALVASWAPESAETITRRELERRAGRALTERDVDRLAAMGVLDRTGGTGADRTGGTVADRTDDPAVERTGETAADRTGETVAGRSGGTAADRSGDAYRLDGALLRLGVELLDVPIEHETILASRTVLLEHARAAAQELSRLFRDEVWDPYRESGEDPDHLSAMRSLSAHMQPMVVQALVTAFQRSLSEELRTAFRSP